MAQIKCTCGEAKCTTVITVEHSGGDAALVGIEHSEKDHPYRLSLYLDPNGIVQLVRALRDVLADAGR